jgi:hypothetical protein
MSFKTKLPKCERFVIAPSFIQSLHLAKWTRRKKQTEDIEKIRLHVSAKPAQSSAPAQTNNRRRGRPTRTHLIRGLLVGAGIQQQPRTARVIPFSGQNQRRPSVLRARMPTCRRRPQCRRTHAHTSRHACK